MRLKKILPIALGGGLGGPLFIFILIMILSPNVFVKGIVMKNLEKSFGGKARAEEASFGWKKGVVISKLFIQDEEGKRPILKVDNVRLKFAIFPLLKGKLVIHRLEVNRPEMVIYRGGPKGQKGPSLDGAPELGSVSEISVGSANLPTAQYTFPDIIEAKINEGTFTFTDLDRGESTRVENLNVTLTGLRPGGTAQINGECDIIGGGGKDHAAISGTVQGFELTRLEALRGKLAFSSGFADVQAAVDMSRLNKPGTKVLKASVKGDFQKAITRLGAILPLSEEVKIRGRMDSEIDAIAQPGGAMLLEGQTSTADLYLEVPPLLKDPFRSSQATFFHRIGINPKEGTLNIEKFILRTDDMNIESSGVLHRDGTVKATLHLGAPLEGLTARLAPAYAPLGQVTAIGDLRSDIEIQGTFGKTITLNGTSRAEGLDLESKSFRYADQEVSLHHDLDYDQEKAIVHIRNIEFASSLLTLNLKQGLIKLGDDGHHRGKLSLLCNMEEVSRRYKLPTSLGPKGVGRVNLDLKGPITRPFYKGLTANGTIGMDEVIYDNYKVTKIATEQLTLENNHLNAKLNMEVNGTPVGAIFDVDFAVNEDGGPHIEAELHASNVPVTHVMREGELSGLLSVDTKVRGDGLDWDKTLKKTLTANGNVNMLVEQGKVPITNELAFSFLEALNISGVEHYEIDSITTDFNIQNERIYTPNSQKFIVEGKPFDMELSGWMGFDQKIDYRCDIYNITAPIPSERVGKDLQKVLELTKELNIPIPLTLKGTLSRPDVDIDRATVLRRSPEMLFELLSKGVFKGPEEAPTEPKELPEVPAKIPQEPEQIPQEPKVPPTTLEDILQEILKVPEPVPQEPKEAPEKPAEIPTEPKEQPQEGEPAPKTLEDIFKEIFK
ncbi:MAG: hypothetical protein ACE5IC_07640 [Candidatus Brocadiales bacterium]